MKNSVHLPTLFSHIDDRDRQASAFALICLGIIESLTSGLINGKDAIRLFFHSENCEFVQKKLKVRIADQIMSRGVQLPDLFDTLPPEEAQRELQQELIRMHTLCIKLLEDKKIAVCE